MVSGTAFLADSAQQPMLLSTLLIATQGSRMNGEASGLSWGLWSAAVIVFLIWDSGSVNGRTFRLLVIDEVGVGRIRFRAHLRGGLCTGRCHSGDRDVWHGRGPAQLRRVGTACAAVMTEPAERSQGRALASGLCRRVTKDREHYREPCFLALGFAGDQTCQGSRQDC